jgi:hypothetical protein
MATPGPSPTGLLFYGLTAPRQELSLIEEVSKKIQSHRGELLAELEPFSFSDLTDYYAKEMGEDLVKKFLLFRRPINLENTASLKKDSNALEKLYLSKSGKSRKINIDPGVLTLFNFCLLTAKGFSHRIYLGEGIYIEVTLRAIRGKLRFFEWTYPDYKTKNSINFLEFGRQRLKQIIFSQNSVE